MIFKKKGVSKGGKKGKIIENKSQRVHSIHNNTTAQNTQKVMLFPIIAQVIVTLIVDHCLYQHTIIVSING